MTQPAPSASVEIPARSATADDARAFAETVAAIAARHARPDAWHAGAAASDADPAMANALREAGWDELATDDDLLPLAAPAGAALGRALASLAPVDELLGGALRVGELARYAESGKCLVEPRAGALERRRPGELTPVPYTDALGVMRVGGEASDAELGGDDPCRVGAWAAAHTGYLGGIATEALRLALEHARSRHAFGGPLTALEPVQQQLADAATLANGLELVCAGTPGLDELAHAGEAAERVVSICMQVTGALGFTLEFPLQRAYRRTRAGRAWTERVLLAWDEDRAA